MSGRFTIEPAPLEGLLHLTRKPIRDDRGFLARIFAADEMQAMGWSKPVADVNFTHTVHQGTVRGLHFQHPPHTEAKLVQCVKGVIWDVAVDIRAGSPTFLHWYGVRLSPDRHNALLIPEGFAHGFQSLTDEAEILYLNSHAYTPDADAGLNPSDPALAIDWPLSVGHLSDKDRDQAMITDAFRGIAI